MIPHLRNVCAPPHIFVTACCEMCRWFWCNCVGLGHSLYTRHLAPRDSANAYVYVQQDEYSILNSKHFIGIHGYMIVYSVASKQSFETVRIIREKILNHLVSIATHPSHQQWDTTNWLFT